MFRRIFAITRLTTLAVLGSLLVAGTAAAQNQGYSVWSQRNESGSGGSSRSYFSPGGPAYYGYAAASSPSAPAIRNQSLYPPQSESYYGSSSTEGYYDSNPLSIGAPADGAVSINVSVPADAEIWFGGSKTVQTGTLRHFVSPPVVPGRAYTYEVQAKWKEDGREVTQNRRITVHAGEVRNLTFGPHSVARSS